MTGEGNLAGGAARANEDDIGLNEDYNRIATLAASLTREELLTLDVETILRRLFWEEKLLRFEPRSGMLGPYFARTFRSRERVTNMLRGLGREEAESILAERGNIEVGCDFLRKQASLRPGRCGADPAARRATRCRAAARPVGAFSPCGRPAGR